ncbi:ABC transporter [Pseudozyma hubeiensis SY62]|uniref:ABC transporter n=1 Tax=Pseudozyma hubeiensis (strain SY62) TaxID=1305764 RepID=R9P2W1_PSEHS|nr:ABC transporter [Pseudozyma hubeiensis SY62]GAC95681.1 ABC transporter [Pseudozyma hubeiensis SY62]
MRLCDQDGNILPAAPASLCRSADFTFAFQLVFLQLLPALLYIALGSFDVVFAWSRKPRYLSTAAGSNKNICARSTLLRLAAPCLLAIVELVRLIVFLTTDSVQNALEPVHSLVVPALAAKLIASILLTSRAHVLWRRQSRPSTTNVVFLTVCLIFDAVWVRSLATSGFVSTAAFVVSVIGVVVLLACLAVECLSKRELLIDTWTQGRIDSTKDKDGFAHQHIQLSDVKPSRALTANVLSRAAHFWLLPTIWRGHNTELTLDHLEQPDDPAQVQNDIGDFQRRWQHVCDKSVGGPGSNALAWTILYTFRATFLRPVLPKLLFIAVSFAQPFLIERTTSYLRSTTQPQIAEPGYHGWGLVAAYALVYSLTALLTAHYQSIVDDSACRVRRTLVSIIYQKFLRLNHDAAHSTGAGGATTLISADMERVCNGLVLIHEFWASLLQIGIALWLAYDQISYAFLVPVVMTVISIGVTTYISNRMRSIVVRWTKAMQIRVKTVTHVMNNITSIKLSSRFSTITRQLSMLRKAELAAFKAAMWVATLLVVSANDLENYTTLLTLVAYSAIAQSKAGQQTLDTTKLFTVISVLTLLRNPLFLLAQYGPMILAALGASVGIGDFLLKPELQQRHNCDADGNSANPTSSIAVAKNLTLHAPGGGGKQLLSNVDLVINRGQLACITGATGTGKTTLLLALLGEVSPLSSADITVQRDPLHGIAYCAQSAWLQDASIRDNILFHSPFDAIRYKAVQWCLDLEHDLAVMPDGDATSVGPQGSKLSGGQRSRVALARALYSKSPLVMLDDPLAALDASTSVKVVSRLFVRRPVGQQVEATTSAATLLLGGRTVLLACHKLPPGLQPDVSIQLSFNKKTSESLSKVNVEYANEGQSITFPPFISAVGYDESTSPRLLEKASSDDRINDNTETVKEDASHPRSQLQPWAAFKFYCRTAGYGRVIIYLGFSIFAAVSLAAINLYLYFWSNTNDRHPNSKLWAWIGGYAAVVTLNSLALTGQIYYLFVRVAQSCADRMHSSLLSSTLAAPLSYFLNTSAGSIVNRLSQDLFVSDNDMTKAIFNVSSNLGVVLGSVMLLSLASPWFLLILPILLPALWLIKSFYLRTSGQIRKLDLESKSPLYTLFGETIDGIVTIRAFAGHRVFTRLNEVLVSRSQRAFFLNLSLMRWLTLVSGLIVAGISTAFCSLSVGLAQRSAREGGSSQSTVGWVAVGLTQLMMLTAAITMLTKAWTQLELCLVAIERLQQVATLEAEADPYKAQSTTSSTACSLGAKVVARSICVDHVHPETGLATKVLRNLSFTLLPGEKVAVVGRTASGKSSLISALLRFTPLSAGNICLDGDDASQFGLAGWRQRVLVLPQQAVVVPSCTLRQNLCLLVDEARTQPADSDLWQALKRVSLDDLALKLGGLEIPLDQAQNGETQLSNGQKQLLALAQLLIACQAIRASHDGQNGTLLILDEPTASLDEAGDALLRQLLHDVTAFGGFTTLMVSHRFGPVLCCDKVLLLRKHSNANEENEESFEFGQPEQLFRDNNSAFGALARDAGVVDWKQHCI